MNGRPGNNYAIRVAIALFLLGLTLSIPFITTQREREYLLAPFLSPLFQTEPDELPFGYPPIGEGLVNTKLYLRLPSMPPPRGLDARPTFLPLVGVTYPCGSRLFGLLENDPRQERPEVRCNRILTRAAQAKALDMVTRKYFSHITPDRETANEWARRHGCNLPSLYPEKGNTIESIGLNYHSAEAMWDAFVASDGHRPHVLGTAPTYRDQIEIGIGYAETAWGKVYVVFSSASC